MTNSQNRPNGMHWTAPVGDPRKALFDQATLAAMEAILEKELQNLNVLEAQLWQEFAGSSAFTPAQRLTTLSEIRKVIHLRGLMTGMVPVRTQEND